MTRVAVICAYNPGNNGMATVDRAARQVMREEKVPHTLINVQRLRKRDLLKPFTHLRGPETWQGYTHVLYWGDFLNNPLYGLGDFMRREAWQGRSQGEARRFWIDTFLRASDCLGRDVPIAAVGGCFLGSDSYGEDGEIQQAFQKFCRTADLIIPREDRSLHAVSALSGCPRPPNLVTGLDAAFLGSWRPTSERRPQFSYVFHRSRITVEAADIRRIEELTGLQAVEIPWTDTGVRIHRGLSRSIRTVQQSQFVLTDVYHVCVNALNLGIPVACVANPGTEMHGTLSDAKKAALLEAVGAEDFLVRIEPGGRLAQAVPQLARLWEGLGSGAELEPRVLENIAARRETMRREIRRFLGVS